MAVNAKTAVTFDNPVIKDDLQDAYTMIAPTETPFQMAIGSRSITSTLYEWTTVDLDDVDLTNRVAEGDDDPPLDDPNRPERLQNYTNLNTKFVSVSETEMVIDAAAENVQRIAKQIVLKTRAMKRTTEAQLLQNIAASAGVTGTPSVAAGFPTFLRTNIIQGAGGTPPTLSGTTNGYPDAAGTPGTAVPITEANFKSVIQSCWNEGADPTLAMVNGSNKVVISETFTGTSTRYKDAIDRRIVAAIDVYESDFGTLQIVPNRFQPAYDAPTTTLAWAVYIIDPNYVRKTTLVSPRKKKIAETGLSKKELVWQQVGLQVDTELAHGALTSTDGTAAP